MIGRDDNFFGNYGVESGYNQVAPGRDTAVPKPQGQPGRPRTNPVIQNAVAPPVTQPAPQQPSAPVQPFKGAQQTIGATPNWIGSAINAPNFEGPGSIADSHNRLNAPQGGSINNVMPQQQQAQPAAYQPQGPAMGLEGFDATKMTSGHVSPKYVFAKHAQGLGVNDRDELLRRLQADESGYFKNASFGGSKGDRLIIGGQLDPKFNGISEFDVIRAMGEGGRGWQWQDANGGAPQGGGFAPGLASGYLDPSVMQSAIMASGVPQGSDYTQRILQQIQAALAGGKL